MECGLDKGGNKNVPVWVIVEARWRDVCLGQGGEDEYSILLLYMFGIFHNKTFLSVFLYSSLAQLRQAFKKKSKKCL